MSAELIRVLIASRFENDFSLISKEFYDHKLQTHLDHAKNEEEFASKLPIADWDIVLMSTQFTQDRGLKLLEKLKRDVPRRPVVFVSHQANDEEIVQAIKAGADDYVRIQNGARFLQSIQKHIRKGPGLLATIGEDSPTAALEISQATRQFIRDLTHDFNNLFGILSLLAENIEQRPDDGARVKQNAEQLLETLERSRKLISRMSSFGRNQGVNPETFDLNELLTGLAPALQETLNKQGKLIVKLASTKVPIFVDRADFEQAIKNLILTARQALSKNGTLAFETGIDKLGQAQLTFQIQLPTLS